MTQDQFVRFANILHSSIKKLPVPTTASSEDFWFFDIDYEQMAYGYDFLLETGMDKEAAGLKALIDKKLCPSYKKSFKNPYEAKDPEMQKRLDKYDVCCEWIMGSETSGCNLTKDIIYNLTQSLDYKYGHTRSMKHFYPAPEDAVWDFCCTYLYNEEGSS